MATIQSLIAQKRARIEARVASESDLTDELISDLGKLKLAETDDNGAGPTVVDPVSISAGVDGSSELLEVKDLLSDILTELINSKAFADIVVQDSQGTPFIRRDGTGSAPPIIENFDGTPGTPVGTIVPLKNGSDTVLEKDYYAKVAGPGFSAGHSLSSLKVIDSSRNVTLLGWFNITTQLVIAAPPTAAIKGYEDLIEELITQLIDRVPVSLGAKPTAESLAIALATDTELPLPVGAATELKQDEQLLALEAIGTTLGTRSKEQTQIQIRDVLGLIEADTDVLAVAAPLLATKANQDTANTALDAIESSVALAATASAQADIIDRLDTLLVELSKSKEFEDLLVQDEAGTVFIRREVLNESTNLRTITIENFDGTTAIPVGAVTTVKQIRSNSIVTRNYYAKTAGTGFALGDSLATMQIINGETNAVTMLGWFNITQQTSIAAPAVAQISGYEDRNEELLSGILALLPPALGSQVSIDSLSVALASDAQLPLPLDAARESTLATLAEALGLILDTSFPADARGDANVKGLLRLTAEGVLNQLISLGDINDTDVAGSYGDFATFKSIIRGTWKDLIDTIGGVSDNSTGAIQDTGTLKLLIRALGGLLVDGTQLTGLYDQGTGERAVILPRTSRATDEQALVVAISPSTPVLVDQLPGYVETLLNDIKTNTASVRYEFNLAQTTAGLVFLIRTDKVSGTSININIPTGLAFAPGSIEMSDPVVSGGGGGTTKDVELNEFVTLTTVAGQWVLGDILTRILIVDTANNTSTAIWQGATGVLLTSTPVIGVDAEDTDKRQLAQLKSIDGKIPALGAALIAGSVPVNIASDQSLTMSLNDKHITGAAFTHPGGVNILLTTTGTLAAIDLSGYRSFSIQVASTALIANQWVLEGSNDNVNFVSTPCVDQANPTLILTGNIAYSQSPIIYIGRRIFRYLRLRNLSLIPAGTVQAITTLSPLDVVLPITVGLAANSLVGAQLAAGSNIVDLNTLLTSAPVGNGATLPFTPTWGTSISFTYQVVMSAAGSNLILSVQESTNGTIWTDLYSWPTLSSATANATLSDTSPVFANTSKFYRFFYFSTVNAGGTWALNFSHNQLNHAPNALADARIDTSLSLNIGVSNSLNVFGRGVASFALSGTWTGTCQVQVTADGTNWFTLATNTAVYNAVAKAFANNGNITSNGIYEINCGGFRAVRLVSGSGGTGTANVIIRATTASSIVAIEGQVNVSVNNTSLVTRSDTSQLNLDQAATITASNTSGTFFQSWGTSRILEIAITAITPTTLYLVEIQELFGTNWRTVHRFAPTSQTGILRTPLLPNTANYRYVETLTGTSLSVTRTTTRIQSNLQALVATITGRISLFNVLNAGIEQQFYGRVRRLTANNRSAALMFLHIYDKASALVAGDVPVEIFPMPINSALPFTVADFGSEGTILGAAANPRVAFSTAFEVYAAPVIPANRLHLFAEVI